MFMFEELNRTSERSYLSTVAPMLGDIRLRQGDIEAARGLAEMGRDLALDEDVASQAQWRILLAKVAAREGETDRAVLLATEAVEWMERSDQLSWTADLHMGRAEVQVSAGLLDDARSSVRHALQLYQTKENIPDSRRARARLDELGQG